MLGIRIDPETILMLPFALIIDLISIVLLFFGLDDFGVTDTVAMFTLGLWLKFRKGLDIKISKKDSKKILRFFGSTIAEYIPYLGAIPFWTGMVLLTLKESNDQEEPVPAEDEEEEEEIIE
ncbi:hypothetical protein KBB74_01845 [Candidatus Parcubacteria bacterium]|nr:hypothetical protein [Candidatus Parcubacteria bacterium]